MRRMMLIALTFVIISLLGASSAGAVVIDMGASGRYGVALVPGTRSALTTAGITTVTGAATPCDPWLDPDFIFQSSGLCYHDGPILHANETFAVTWDPHRRDWQTARDYVEQFLKDVADGSAAPKGSPSLTSQYALTSQYRGWSRSDSDPSGRARYASLYGGGCVDFGQPGGSACKFASAIATGPGHNDLGNDCPVSGMNYFWQDPSGAWGPNGNVYCITDDQIRTEVSEMVGDMGLVGRTQTGFSPLIVLRLPPGVVTCLDGAGTVCSANGVSTVQFCSYHALATVGGTLVPYVVQPWTAKTPCDDPGIPTWNDDVSTVEYATEAAQRLVSPLSQGELAAITDPELSGWYALDGSEINDNGCIGFPKSLDQVTVGASGQNPYWLQREFNNAGAIVSDPNAPRCAPLVDLLPTFVVPSPIDAGDIVAFDGSVTDSTLLIPQASYLWNFGDGTSRVGASVVHQFAKGGVYTVKLTVTDRGGYSQSVSEQVTVLGPGGTTPPPPPPPPNTGPAKKSKLNARLALIPQGFRTILRSGIVMRVTSNEPAAGLTRVWISKRDASRAHIRTGRSSTVVIGRGTVSGITNGTIKLHLHLSRDITKKLSRLRHLKLTVRMSLTASSGDHATVDAAGSY
jgi:hypothetical protein